jgi:hypothetical protein
MTRTKDHWPDYLRRVKDKRVAVEHPEPGAHYTFFAQMASRDLFAWTVWVTRGAYETVIYSFPDGGGLFQLFLTSLCVPTTILDTGNTMGPPTAEHMSFTFPLSRCRVPRFFPQQSTL